MVLIMSGCASLQRETAKPPVTGVEETQPPEPPPPPTDAPEGMVVDAIEWIEAGEMERALQLLDRLAEQGRADATVRLLATQLREPPQELLPGPYREVVLARGESLSEVAERELGNPLYFVALARLNQIAVPRRVAAGSRLRVPVLPVASPPLHSDRTEAAPAGGPAEALERDLLSLADVLVASDQAEQALKLLGTTLAEEGGSETLQRRYLEIGLARLADLEAAQGWDEARAWLEQASMRIDEPSLRARLNEAGRRIAAAELGAAARAERDRGNLEAALRLARQALEQAPDDPQAVALEQELRVRWTRELHGEALRAWRERDVDRSIRIWQRLLALVPDFKPASVYLERALELRRRLQ